MPAKKNRSLRTPSEPVNCWDDEEAAAKLGIGVTKLAELKSRPKEDPTRIRTTSYNKIPHSELLRHVAEEMKRA